MQIKAHITKTVLTLLALLLLSVPAMAENGHSPENGNCLDNAVFSLDHGVLLARGGGGGGGGGGNGGGGNDGGNGNGPGDGEGNGGVGPQDGTGYGNKTGDCINS